MTEIKLSTGDTVYSEDTVGQFQIAVNSAHSRGAAVYLVYADEGKSEKLYINLTKVVSFKEA